MTKTINGIEYESTGEHGFIYYYGKLIERAIWQDTYNDHDCKQFFVQVDNLVYEVEYAIGVWIPTRVIAR